MGTGMNMSMSKLESAGTAEREPRAPARARASRSRRASGRARRDGGPAGFGGRLSSARDRQKVRERNAAERTRVEEMLGSALIDAECECLLRLFRLPHLLLWSSLDRPPVRFMSERWPAPRPDVPSARAARLCGTTYSKRARPCVYRNVSIVNTDGRLDLVHDGASWVRE